MQKGKYVLELGPGTGCLTKSLLEAGVPKERLLVVELDKELCTYLGNSMPDLNVIHGNACDLTKILPKDVIGNISTVISGIPMTTLSAKIQGQIIDACFAVMGKNGEMLQYTYRPISPIPAAKLGLSKQRIGMTFKNLPPATVWRYQRAA